MSENPVDGRRRATAIRRAYSILLPAYSTTLCYDLIGKVTGYRHPTVYNICRNHIFTDAGYIPPSANEYKKTCYGCGKVRNRNRYGPDPSTSDGLSATCLYCLRICNDGTHRPEPRFKPVPFDDRGEFECASCGMRTHNKWKTDEERSRYGTAFTSWAEADACCRTEED